MPSIYLNSSESHARSVHRPTSTPPATSLKHRLKRDYSFVENCWSPPRVEVAPRGSFRGGSWVPSLWHPHGTAFQSLALARRVDFCFDRE